MSNDAPSSEQGDERRIANILARVRREVGVRDLVTFSLGRMWTVLLSLGAAVYALFSRRHSGSDEADANEVNQ